MLPKNFKTDVESIKNILKDKKTRISRQQIIRNLEKITSSEVVFPSLIQKALMVRLLSKYESTKLKQVIIMEEMKGIFPVTIMLGVLAEDWAGMSNTVLGIIHHAERNVLSMRGFTLNWKDKNLGIVILAFKIENKEKHQQFSREKKSLVKKISEASVGSVSKTQLLDDEVIKMEIYSDVVKRIKKTCKKEEIPGLIGQSGEVLKFITCRSREYLAERKILDLARLTMDNYRFIREVRNKKTDVAVSINNFITKYERLTGITFVCREVLISIEDFLRTLEFIVPEHIIKHHKSFVTLDEIMVYRLEITDRYKKPLKPEVIKSIEKSLKKLIVSSYSKSFAQLKSIGGFEHFARAIIPFLMEELKKTALTQVFINTDKKTLFSIEIRLIIVSNIKGKYKEKYFISKLLNFPGFDITSFVPARKYSMGIEVSLLQIKVDLSEFATLNEIYSTLRGMLEKFYGIIHDFDKGFREIDLIKLNELSKNMPDVPQSLIREIYFSFDALYRIETPGELLQTIIELCGQTVKESEEKSPNEILFKSYNNFERDRIILVISCMGKRRKKILNRMVRQLQDIDINFSKIEWNQRSYLLLILGSKGKTLNRNVMKDISNFIDNLIH